MVVFFPGKYHWPPYRAFLEGSIFVKFVSNIKLLTVLIKFYIGALFNFNVYCFKNKTQEANVCKTATVLYGNRPTTFFAEHEGQDPVRHQKGLASAFRQLLLFSLHPGLHELPLGLTGLGQRQSVLPWRHLWVLWGDLPPWSSHLQSPHWGQHFCPGCYWRCPAALVKPF